MQSVTQAMRKNANITCYCIIWIVQEFLREADAEYSETVCYFME